MFRWFWGCPLFLVIISCASTQEGSGRGIASVAPVHVDQLINQLKPFQPYGCDTFFKSIAYPQVNQWELCCVQHNAAYWRGGSSQDRFAADQRLQSCLVEIGHANTAGLVFKNKRALQAIGEETPTPWGYGWVLKRGYAPFSEQELKQVESLEKQIPTDLSTISLRKKKATVGNESVSGNICLDASLEFIQSGLSRKMTPLSVSEEKIIHSRTSMDYKITLRTKECHMPYVFTYRVKNEQSCRFSKGKRLPLKDVSLSHVDYPVECLE